MKLLNIYKKNLSNDLEKIGIVTELISNKMDNKFSIIIQSLIAEISFVENDILFIESHFVN